MLIKNILLMSLFLALLNLQAQTGTLTGTVMFQGEVVPWATIQLKDALIGTTSNEAGKYLLEAPYGTYTVVCKSIGYQSVEKVIALHNSLPLELNFQLEEDVMDLEQVVVTGTRTDKRRTDSPVIVNLINSKTLDHVVATNLSEGLRFQPGLRVETDCQTCNYTQLRINGLQGGYSQILINGRPIFSPLTGLYGMEQIPANMIERIEIVRGGASALYGSSAIGGTVNVMTKIPRQNDYTFTYTFQNMGKSGNDHILVGNATMVNTKKNAGATFFVSKRDRDTYDANGDNFSELPQLRNNSFGSNFFYIPKENQKLEVSISSIHEYRYGGEMVNKPAHLAQQSEERTHNVIMGSLDYQINFNDEKSALILNYGGQYTDRDHYTGIIPDQEPQLGQFYVDPPYGKSHVTTHQGGVQYNHRFNSFLGGKTVFTLGSEYVYDEVLDAIAAYNYNIDQTMRNLGGFVQNDWEITPDLNFLSGFRIDEHNLLHRAIISPRLSLLYKWNKDTQFRMGWGTGFRAPQAFDTDLHIAFAGGGISRISLTETLKEERSNSFTGSINFDKATEQFIAGFTLEGFYTHLNDAFYLFPLGEDEFGERFEKRNGSGASVKGITLESRANFDYMFQIEAGFTLQSSLFDKALENIEGLEAKREFLRTPNAYGYATFTYTPTKKLSASANIVYTGPMELVHFGGEGTGQTVDEYSTSPSFTELSLRMGYVFDFPKIGTGMEVFGGVKNMTNAYQEDFDMGKNRDSNYVYGPGAPRTVFVGLRIKSL
jgi:outer membrane receptor for ferrienterochelin and colicins